MIFIFVVTCTSSPVTGGIATSSSPADSTHPKYHVYVGWNGREESPCSHPKHPVLCCAQCRNLCSLFLCRNFCSLCCVTLEVWNFPFLLIVNNQIQLPGKPFCLPFLLVRFETWLEIHLRKRFSYLNPNKPKWILSCLATTCRLHTWCN